MEKGKSSSQRSGGSGTAGTVHQVEKIPERGTLLRESIPQP